MKKYRIAEIGNVVTGKTPSSRNPEHFGDIYPFITPTDINAGRAVNTARYLSEEGYRKFHRLLLPPLSICFVCIGATIGKICMTSERSLTNQQINSIIVDTKRHNPFYVYYLLSTYSKKVASIAGGAATPIVNKTSFENIEVAVPSLSLQNKIAAILSAYDDLIENNLRRIKILEEMAQNLYREWFVNFRFPSHENTRFVDSSLGKIPEGWKVVKLTDELEVTRGLSYSGKYLSNNGLPMHNLNSIREGGWYKFTGIKYYDGPHKEKDIVIPGDIVVANTEQTWERLLIGCAAIIPHCFSQKGIYSHHLYRVRPLSNSYLTKPFIFLMLNDEGLRDWVSRFGNGTTINMLPRDALLLPKIVKPPRYLIESITKKTNPVFVLIENLNLKNQTLHLIRDLLLPKLISGEVDVSELDINVPEEVAI